ncbi:hypothetical protein GCM10007913_11590 [Devosia yakushimensis]|uniref:Uncharacterized protein n=1 Tax=Devosia yakushimensis TaxID=470028 RepID=A0ABQ5UAS9_9HYPH|nr:hypothetical protein [Devosia yakushimensis]GLQ09227.1 hypothetical protein GCM10007913_11590 [Devosia yakushimensis]
MAPDVSLSAISYHAVTRYVQRVLGVIVPGDEAVMGAKALAADHCAAIDTTIDAVRAKILTPVVAAAIADGCTCIRTATYEIEVSQPEKVATTIHPRARQRAIKIMGKAEHRRSTLRHARRHGDAGAGDR